MNKKLYTDRIEIRDARSKSMYRVDDAYLNGYAKLCGVYCTAVYNSLSRHVDSYQQAFPSIDLMADQHSISRPTVIRAIKTLEKWGIIQVIRAKNKKTKRQLPNVYVLIDKVLWKPKPSKRGVLGAESISHYEPSQSHDQSRVNQVDCKEAHIKDTHNKEEVSNETTERIRAMKKEIGDKLKIGGKP